MRILWLKTELLHPVDKGGKIRTYAMLRELARDHSVTYLTLDDGHGGADALDRAREYANRVITVPFRPARRFSPRFYAELLINLLDPLPYAVSKYRSRPMRKALNRELQDQTYDVVVCDFLAPSVNVDRHLSVPTVLFEHNVEATIWRRHFEVAESVIKRQFMRFQWRRMFAYERKICRNYDHVIAVSERDAAQLSEDYAVPEVSWVPTGVDTEFFRPGRSTAIRPHELVFTGAMDWMPNEDAIIFMLEEILPRIRQQIPDVTLTVVGRDPTTKLQRLVEGDSAVQITGRVEDVRPYMDRAAVYVIPIRVGSGTRLKVYEAMAMEKPIVSTTIGAEGLDVQDGKDILLRDSPSDFAQAVVELLEEPERGSELGRLGGEKVRTKYGWRQVSARFAAICEKVTSAR